jgi:L-rhamnose mutarotase
MPDTQPLSTTSNSRVGLTGVPGKPLWKQIMKRVGFQFKVRQDRIAEYKEHHTAVWPEMLTALRTAGWHNYSLFMRADGLIFGYFETDESLAVAQARMAATEVNARWQTFMAPFFDGNARPDETFVELEEYFHLD